MRRKGPVEYWIVDKTFGERQDTFPSLELAAKALENDNWPKKHYCIVKVEWV